MAFKMFALFFIYDIGLLFAKRFTITGGGGGGGRGVSDGEPYYIRMAVLSLYIIAIA